MEECWLTNFMAWIAYQFPYPGFVLSNYPQRQNALTQMHIGEKDKKESLMVSQCANPEGLRELRYLRDGKIYAFAVSAGNGGKSPEHFWLRRLFQEHDPNLSEPVRSEDRVAEESYKPQRFRSVALETVQRNDRNTTNRNPKEELDNAHLYSDHSSHSVC